jgi:hypothetical protein
MEESFTIKEFCAAEKISRSFYYKLDAEGRGPRTYNIGVTRRISRAALNEWRAALESQSAA